MYIDRMHFYESKNILKIKHYRPQILIYNVIVITLAIRICRLACLQ